MSRWVRHLWLGIKLGRGLNHHQGCFWFFFGKAKDQKQTYCWNCDGISWRFDVHTFKCLHQLEQGTVYSILLAGTIAEYYRCVRIELNLWVKASLQLLGSGEISRKIGSSDFSNDLWRACNSHEGSRKGRIYLEWSSQNPGYQSWRFRGSPNPQNGAAFFAGHCSWEPEMCKCANKYICMCLFYLRYISAPYPHFRMITHDYLGGFQHLEK